MNNNNIHTKMKVLEPEDADITGEDYTIAPYNKRWILVHKHESAKAIRPIIALKGCTVKYTPEKYNKITIQLNQYDAGFFIDLSNKIEDVVVLRHFSRTTQSV